MDFKFSKIFSNINSDLNIVETGRFISELKKAMQTYYDNNREVISSPDIVLALKGLSTVCF